MDKKDRMIQILASRLANLEIQYAKVQVDFEFSQEEIKILRQNQEQKEGQEEKESE